MMGMGGLSGMAGMSGMSGMQGMDAMKSRMFSKADADASGGIDSKEFSTMVSISPMGRAAAAGGANTEEMFGKLDGNGDGSLTQAEMEDGMKKAMEFSNSSDPQQLANQLREMLSRLSERYSTEGTGSSSLSGISFMA
jgi:Ca2+-binding EF-hand superfamily protein